MVSELSHFWLLCTAIHGPQKMNLTDSDDVFDLSSSGN